jgi:hypothetical protein
MNELYQQYKGFLVEIANDEQSGKITSTQAAEFRQDLDEQYESALVEFEAGSEEEVAEFSAGNSLGQALLELGEESGYEDAESYLIDLSESLGVTPDEVYNLIVSEVEPDEDLIDDILDTLLPDEDEEDLDEDDDIEYEEDDEDPEASYSASRLNELEDEMAEFKLNQEIKQKLSYERQRSLNLLEEGAMTSFSYSQLFPNVDQVNDDELVACFSALVQENDTDIVTELIRINAVNDFCEKSFPEGFFADVIRQEQQAAFSQQDYDPEEDATAKATADYYLQNLI